jgi:hypothetical protein
MRVKHALGVGNVGVMIRIGNGKRIHYLGSKRVLIFISEVGWVFRQLMHVDALSQGLFHQALLVTGSYHSKSY